MFKYFYPKRLLSLQLCSALNNKLFLALKIGGNFSLAKFLNSHIRIEEENIIIKMSDVLVKNARFAGYFGNTGLTEKCI